MDELDQMFTEWIKRIGRSSPPPPDISALNIGLFETPTGYAAYLIGLKKYDPTDDDWACQEDYSPNEKFLELPAEFVNGKGWQQVENDMLTVIARFLAINASSENVLTNAAVVTVGFDDGTLTRVK